MSTAPSAHPLGLPIDTQTCFSNHKGEYRKTIEKQQTQLLGKAAPVLGPLLEAEEQVLLAAPACSPMTLLEQMTTGWVIYFIKRCLLVVTNRRILHLLTKPNGTPRPSVAEVRYGDLTQASVTSFPGRGLKLRYRNGGTETFNHLDSSVTDKLKALLPAMAGKGETSPTAGRHHLCPRCAKPLTAAEYRSANCFLEFKTPAAAQRCSILFPGGGYFYTGHPLLGILDAIVETVLLIVVVGGVVGFALGERSADAVAGLGVILALVIEKLLTVYHARHYVSEYLPVEREVRPLKAV